MYGQESKRRAPTWHGIFLAYPGLGELLQMRVDSGGMESTLPWISSSNLKLGFRVGGDQKTEVASAVWAYTTLIQPLWRHYFHSTQGLIFVAGSNDRDCVVEARDKLHRLLNEWSINNSDFWSLHLRSSKWIVGKHSVPKVHYNAFPIISSERQS